MASFPSNPDTPPAGTVSYVLHDGQMAATVDAEGNVNTDFAFDYRIGYGYSVVLVSTNIVMGTSSYASDAVDQAIMLAKGEAN